MAFFGTTDEEYAALYRYIKVNGKKMGWGWSAVYLNDTARLSRGSNRVGVQLEILIPGSKEWHYVYGDETQAPWCEDIKKLARLAVQTEYENYNKAENQMFRGDRFEKIDIE